MIDALRTAHEQGQIPDDLDVTVVPGILPVQVQPHTLLQPPAPAETTEAAGGVTQGGTSGVDATAAAKARGKARQVGAAYSPE